METQKDRGLGSGLLAACVITLLWSGNFVAGKYATGTAGTPGLDPLLIGSIRIFSAAAFFPLLLSAEQRRALRRPGLWRDILPLGLAGIVANQFLFAAGIKLTSPSHSALVHALIPVFVMLIGWILLREPTRPVKLVGVLLAIGGASYVALTMTADERAGKLTGDLLTFGGAVSFALYIVLGRNVLRRMDPLTAVTAAFIVSVPFSLPFFGWAAVRQDWGAVSGQAWAAFAYMIVAATFICYTLHMYALSKIGPLRVAIFTNLQPILGTVIAQGFGKDELTPAFATCAVVVIAGVAMVQFTRDAAPSIPSAPRGST
jgi:drug/metabolite transporter (DMT)-like permease